MEIRAAPAVPLARMEPTIQPPAFLFILSGQASSATFEFGYTFYVYSADTPGCEWQLLLIQSFR